MSKSQKARLIAVPAILYFGSGLCGATARSLLEDGPKMHEEEFVGADTIEEGAFSLTKLFNLKDPDVFERTPKTFLQTKEE